MRLFYDNLIDAAAVAFSSTSEASSALGPQNVAHEFKTKVWRTGSSTADESITFDLGAAQAATSIIIFAHTLTGSDTDIELRCSTDNFAANDDLVASLTHTDVIHATFNSTSKRYWRIAFTKSAAGQSRDIGRVFLGTYYETSFQPDFEGLQVAPKDLSTHARSSGGQIYTDIRGQYRQLRTEFSAVPQAMTDSIKTILEDVGIHTSFFVQVDPNASSEAGEILYVKFRDVAAREVDGMDSDLTWKMRLDFEEQL